MLICSVSQWQLTSFFAREKKGLALLFAFSILLIHENYWIVTKVSLFIFFACDDRKNFWKTCVSALNVQRRVVFSISSTFILSWRSLISTMSSINHPISFYILSRIFQVSHISSFFSFPFFFFFWCDIWPFHLIISTRWEAIRWTLNSQFFFLLFLFLFLFSFILG